MHKSRFHLFAASALALTAGLFWFSTQATQTASQKPEQKQAQLYETRRDHDPDGIGRFYMGREIAHVMGHQGAEWLERSDREETELPQQVVENLSLKADSIVADIGAGTGYFTFRISPRVPQGKVYAVDIQPEMLELIEERKKRTGAKNVITVHGTETNPRLPAHEVEVVLMVDAYHEFSWPREMMENIVLSLKPGGRVVLIEYRGEDPEVPIKRVHKMTQQQAKREMAAVGLKWRETRNFLPLQHFMIFEKSASQ
ncbi:MAG TPA: class I SAM-dependent methyltransferase [Blastocatellia bacterium]|nr:class I SAM-dependent methyltransferase [Blastocatellia bacterium]